MITVEKEIEQKIVDMILSGNSDNFELALLLLESQGIDSDDFYQRHFSELLDYCKKVTQPHFRFSLDKGNWDSISKLINVVSLDILTFDAPHIAVPEMLFNLPKLKEVRIYGDKGGITTIPKKLFTMKNLTSLRIVNVLMDDLPDEIKNLENLEFLKIIDCGLKNLNPNLEYLKKLILLQIEGNHFEKFPDVICKIPRLCDLSFTKNKVEFPLEFPINNLFSVNFTGCGLSEFPIGLKGKTKLAKIQLAGNPIKEIPNWVFKLPDLCYLTVDGGAFSEIEQGILESMMPNGETLYFF